MKQLRYLNAAALICLVSTSLWLPSAWGGEGHDHGESPAAAAPPASPIVIAVSESFELVGRLKEDELSMLVDRHISNEPVLAAELTVESGGRSFPASFHDEHGDYTVNDPALLSNLHQPGSKPLTFSLVVGDEKELLTGELDIHEEHIESSESTSHWLIYVLGAGGGLALLTVLMLRLRGARTAQIGGAV